MSLKSCLRRAEKLAKDLSPLATALELKPTERAWAAAQLVVTNRLIHRLRAEIYRREYKPISGPTRHSVGFLSLVQSGWR